jgi:hypothetical protein
MVKKKVHKDSLEYQNYLREKERGFRAGGGVSSGYGGGSSGFGGGISSNIPKSYAANVSKPVNISQNIENVNNNLDKPKNNLFRAANNERELKTLKYYQDDNDNKFDTIGTKEFYQLNKDRYLNELWKEENEKLEKIDEDFNKNKKKVLPNDEELKKDNKGDLQKSKIDKKLLLFNKPICSKCGKLQNKNNTKGVYFCSDCE